jgi:cardiolipin synthase (CMP-forming)
VNIPNALTLARIILVPLIVWLIITHEMAAAFVLFLLAGLSDAEPSEADQDRRG